MSVLKYIAFAGGNQRELARAKNAKKQLEDKRGQSSSDKVRHLIYKPSVLVERH